MTDLPRKPAKPFPEEVARCVAASMKMEGHELSPEDVEKVAQELTPKEAKKPVD